MLLKIECIIYDTSKYIYLRMKFCDTTFFTPLRFGIWPRFQQNGERGVLLFTATMTVVRNGRVQEVPFDTQTEAFDLGDRRGVTLPTVAARETGGQKVSEHQKRQGGFHVVRNAPKHVGLLTLGPAVYRSSHPRSRL